ncbi:caspase family protein [Sphingobacterium sp.]|uniref:caspase family protein n=1 Tax=Sphingobacterium sp. TaxID=341027 RepID=UPI0025E979CB|nr:caspase family protein [Sphingobacterium sp.]
MANYLFLVGINDYLENDPLYSCVKDCNDLKEILIEKYNFEENKIYEVYNEKATGFNILNAFRKYRTLLSEEDNLIIYYSGHGEYEDAEDVGYWVPYDSTNFAQNISNRNIIDHLDRIKCKHIFLISDSCFSNSLLMQGRFKKSKIYFEKHSRWALTSAFNEARDADSETNTLFCEYILEFLSTADKEFRVSELIEFVKSKYYTNEFQTPQGGPLAISGHRGGEFVFYPIEGIDKRVFKGYSDFFKVLRFYKPNASFVLMDSLEDRSTRIGYILFNEVDIARKITYLLYLYDGTNQTKTLEFLRSKHPKIFVEKNLIVFITPDRTQRSRDIRKRNIQDKFKPVNTFYLDEFIKEHCNPKIDVEEDSKYLSISNFVLPPYKDEFIAAGIDELFKKWFLSVEEPIFVIKGSGGIGKTTLAQYLADDLIKGNPGLQVLFIDSVQIKDSLLKSRKADALNIFNFYEAQFDINGNTQGMLSEELFRINLDAGNILLIIDGLDEVISKIPNFNITEFLSSINQFSSQLCNGKVIITCRSFFWNNSDLPDTIFKTIELEPFDKNKAQEFFDISFDNDVKKSEKAMKIANDFKLPTESDHETYIYHPYVLDIVRTLIQSDAEDLDLISATLDSKYLNSKVKSDFIIYRVCAREQIRVDQIEVDKQIKFFIDFAVNNRGILKAEDLKITIEKSLNQKINNTQVEAFKSHPFLKIIGQTLLFRYDFLVDQFKSIYVSKFITYNDKEIEITQQFIEIVKDSCWYGSAFNNDLAYRLEKWTDDELLLINEILSQIRAKVQESPIKRKAVANIFNLCLTIHHKHFGNNVEKNTDLLNSLFGTTTGSVSELSIIDVNPEKPPRFDFSNLTIENSYFDNFGNFSKCAFNEHTLFMNCTILNTEFQSNKLILSKENFINCSFDSLFDSSFALSENTKEDYSNSLRTFLQSFFKLFYSSGRLGRQWEHSIISPRFGAINKINIEYNKFINTLKKENILLVHKELNKNKFEICNHAKDSVIKFVKDGTIDSTLLKLITNLTPSK